MTRREAIVINDITVEWIDTDDAFRDVLDEQDVATDYALDTEFISGQSYRTELSLVQIGWPNRIVLVDPYSVDLHALEPFFNGPARALLHAASGDLDLLEEAVGVRPARLFDTQVAGQFLGLSTPSLAHLVQKYCGVSLDKTHQRTDWTIRPLSNPVRHYAASDVAYLHELVDKMSAEIESRGRTQWLEDENEIVLTTALSVSEPEELWWRLSRASTIPPNRQLGAQRLVVLRDSRARSRNRPVSHIIHDDAVVALASKPPSTIDEFRRVKGCANIPEPFAREIMQVLAEAKNDSPGELRRLPTNGVPGELDPLITVLAAVATQRAEDMELDFKVLATRKDIADLVLQNPTRLDASWRHEVITSDLRQILAGTLAIGVRDNKVVVTPR
jgi:ribonuclease D